APFKDDVWSLLRRRLRLRGRGRLLIRRCRRGSCRWRRRLTRQHALRRRDAVLVALQVLAVRVLAGGLPRELERLVVLIRRLVRQREQHHPVVALLALPV